MGDLPASALPSAPSSNSMASGPLRCPPSTAITGGAIAAPPVTGATLPVTDPQMSNINFQQLLLLHAIQERHEQLESQLLSGQTKQPDNRRLERLEAEDRLSASICDGDETAPDGDSDMDNDETDNRVCEEK